MSVYRLTEVEELASVEECRYMADYIYRVVLNASSEANKLYLSIAGGRKTMSAIASMAMSLLGREQDILCHVLVNPPFDSPALSPKFYFPDKTRTYLSPDGEKYSAANARITLCALPFVHIRYLFQKEFNRLPGSFRNTVNLANERISGRIEPPDIKIIPERIETFINNKFIKFRNYYSLPCFVRK